MDPLDALKQVIGAIPANDGDVEFAWQGGILNKLDDQPMANVQFNYGTTQGKLAIRNPEIPLRDALDRARYYVPIVNASDIRTRPRKNILLRKPPLVPPIHSKSHVNFEVVAGNNIYKSTYKYVTTPNKPMSLKDFGEKNPNLTGTALMTAYGIHVHGMNSKVQRVSYWAVFGTLLAGYNIQTFPPSVDTPANLLPPNALVFRNHKVHLVSRINRFICRKAGRTVSNSLVPLTNAEYDILHHMGPAEFYHSDDPVTAPAHIKNPMFSFRRRGVSVVKTGSPAMTFTLAEYAALNGFFTRHNIQRQPATGRPRFHVVWETTYYYWEVSLDCVPAKTDVDGTSNSWYELIGKSRERTEEYHRMRMAMLDLQNTPPYSTYLNALAHLLKEGLITQDVYTTERRAYVQNPDTVTTGESDYEDFDDCSVCSLEEAEGDERLSDTLPRLSRRLDADLIESVQNDIAFGDVPRVVAKRTHLQRVVQRLSRKNRRL